MRKRIFIFSLFIISSLMLSSQVSENKITTSDFHHFSDCKQIYTSKRKGKPDTVIFSVSYLFDDQGRMIRKLDDRPADPTRLSIYSFDKKNNIVRKAWYDTTAIKNVFKSSIQDCFYNEIEFCDSIFTINSTPSFNYRQVDQMSNLENVGIYYLPIWRDADSCDVGQVSFLRSSDQKICAGYYYDKMEVVLKNLWVDTVRGLGVISVFNSKNKLLKQESPKSLSDDYYGETNFYYNSEGRICEVDYDYTINRPRAKLDPKEDSIYRWEMGRHTTYFGYQDRMIVETAVYADEIEIFKCWRNEKGQIIKTNTVSIGVDNIYINGRFIASDTTLLPKDKFILSLQVDCSYSYDSLGRIAEKIEKSTYWHSEAESNSYDTSTKHVYGSNRVMILPEIEYVEFRNFHQFLLGQSIFNWL